MVYMKRLGPVEVSMSDLLFLRECILTKKRESEDRILMSKSDQEPEIYYYWSDQYAMSRLALEKINTIINDCTKAPDTTK